MATIGEVCRAASAALRAGDAGRCEQLCRALIAQRPDVPEPHFLIGMVLAERGQGQAALDAVNRAVAIEPRGEFLAQRARLLTMVREDGEARAAADAASATDPHEPNVLDTIGCVYARLGDHEAARPLFERAVAGDPDHLQYRFNLASTYGFFGQRDAAEAQYEAMLAIDPQEARAHYGLASLHRQTAERNHLDRLAGTLDPERLGAEYLRSARHHAGSQAVRFTDKLPLNFLYIGYIAQALPGPSAARKSSAEAEDASTMRIPSSCTRLTRSRAWGKGSMTGRPQFAVLPVRRIYDRARRKSRSYAACIRMWIERREPASSIRPNSGRRGTRYIRRTEVTV